jgi:hypothetical protein
LRFGWAGALGLLAACSGGGSATPPTLPPSSAAPSSAPTSSSATTTTVAASTTTAAVSAAETTLPSTLPSGGVQLTPGGPWRLVDSAPGITTPGLVYELMPKLWVYLPTKEDIAHGITWTFTEADRPVIEAYLQARLVYFNAVTSRPIDMSLDGWRTLYSDRGAAYASALKTRIAAGEYVDLDQGVVLRPQVIGDGRSDIDAVIFDCVLDGGVFRRRDGSLAPGSSVGVAPHGIGFRMSDASGKWIVSQIGDQPDACR